MIYSINECGFFEFPYPLVFFFFLILALSHLNLFFPHEKHSRLDQDSAQLVRAPARRAGDPGSNTGPGENFSFKFSLKLAYMFR